MPFVLSVLVVAVAVSYLRGGRLSNVAHVPLRWTWLLFAGVAIQVATDLAAGRELLPDAGLPTYLLIVSSQLLVVAWVAANWHLAGTLLVAAGLALNAVVMAANGAMPVDPAAIAALGLDGAQVPPGKHTLMTDDTRLPWLADILPVRPLRSILSVGDLVIAVGVVPLTHRLMTQPATRGQPAVAPVGDEATPRDDET